MVGPTVSFLTFPATLVNIDWTDYSGAQRAPLTVRDNDGQDIRFAFSIQYRLTQSQIGQLYTKYKQNYESQFITWADQEVRNTVGKFNSSAFWSDRANSGDSMKNAINDKFTQEGNFAQCVNFQIINVQLSEKREESLINTQVTIQMGKPKKKEQRAKEIRAGITVVES